MLSHIVAKEGGNQLIHITTNSAAMGVDACQGLLINVEIDQPFCFGVHGRSHPIERREPVDPEHSVKLRTFRATNKRPPQMRIRTDAHRCISISTRGRAITAP